MNLSRNQKRTLKSSLRLILFGVFAGLFFVMFADGFGKLYPFINGAIIGFLIALIASIFEFYIYEKTIRKKSFIFVLITRSLFYLILIAAIFLLEIGIARMLKEDLDLAGLLQNEDFNRFLFDGKFVTSVFYAFAIVLVINFTRQISRKMGHKVFVSLISGSNYHPRELEKIFMFLNIPSSSIIIDKIGRLEFHHFINDIVFDITFPIINNYGIIYQYVEDEMVITWNMKDGLENANAIRCFFDIKDKLHEQKEKYVHKYGVVPSVKAALHCGKVVKGEIGFFKSEIVYHGDVLNTTSRILDTCNIMSHEILASGRFMDMIKLPVIYTSDKCGDINLKGKKDPLELYIINEIELKSIEFS